MLSEKNSIFCPDFFFLSETTEFDIFGVFDGIGAWDLVGIDSGYFSHALASKCESLVLSGECGSTPKYLLQSAFFEVLSDEKVGNGSATCLVAYFDKSKASLQTALLGDTSYAVFRTQDNGGDFEVVFKHRDLQHAFNFPFHLAKGELFESGGDMSGTDYPNDALTKTLQLQPSDIIISASDGLFDNIFLAQIIELLNEVDYFGEGLDLAIQEFVEKMCNLAHSQSHDYSFKSPFAVNLSKHNMSDSLGGKPDDITVIVSQVMCSGEK